MVGAGYDILVIISNPALRKVIASEAKQSLLFMGIAAHLPGDRNDMFVKRLKYLSLDWESLLVIGEI